MKAHLLQNYSCCLFVCLLIGLLGACSPIDYPSGLVTTDTPLLPTVNTPPPTVIIPKETPFVTSTPVITPVISETPENQSIQNCLAISSELNAFTLPGGTLILRSSASKPGYFFNLEQQIKVDLADNIISPLSTSPHGKWWAYLEKDEVSRLILAAPERELARTYLPAQNWFVLPSWLDDDRMTFPVLDETSGIPATMILNAETNEQLLLPSVYPEMRAYWGAGGDPLHFIYSSVVYDPTLTYVVYPKTIEGDRYIVLYDRQNHKEISQLKDEGDFFNNPVWFSGGKQFIVAADDSRTEELFLFDLEGHITQLTDFRKIRKGNQVGSISLSPDGTRLAFWISPLGQEVQEQLAVMDLHTREVTDYCIPATDNFGDRPIWSPDGRYILVGDFQEPDHRRTILVDTQDLWAYEIDNALPMGWLAEAEK